MSQWSEDEMQSTGSTGDDVMAEETGWGFVSSSVYYAVLLLLLRTPSTVVLIVHT